MRQDLLKPFTVSAPGSVMITGEHAVVAGYRAIVCAIDQRIRMRVTPLDEPEVQIASSIAPTLKAPLSDLPDGGPYRFILACLARWIPPCGLRLEIASQIDPTLGLGSSAAITVAMVAALDRLADGSGVGGDPGTLHIRALAIVRGIQGRGSGADLAASLSGGVVDYRLPLGLQRGILNRTRAEIKVLPDLPPLSLRYVGYKTPTAEVLQRVAEAWKGREADLAALYAEMGTLSDAAVTAHRQADLARFGASLDAYQACLTRLGVCDGAIQGVLDAAAGCPDLIAAKISGSGLDLPFHDEHLRNVQWLHPDNFPDADYDAISSCALRWV
ncbi:MAG: galactokinase family protein, partial [Pseudomonadota bacterium]